MLEIEAKKNEETGRYYGEVTWAGWQVFTCPNEYDHRQDALNEANRQFAGSLRALIPLSTMHGGGGRNVRSTNG